MKRCSICSINLEDNYWNSMFGGKRCPSCINKYKRLLHKKKREEVLSSKDEIDYIRHKYQNYLSTSKQRGKERLLSLEYLIRLWNIQDGKCAYYGNSISFFIDRKLQLGSKDFATLDRIDSSKGYVPGNVAYCSSRYNSKIKKEIPIGFIEKQMPMLRKNIQKVQKYDL